ncbi:hypothetical protein M5K25_023132 [Dendrobium thyrsiflorum]|uniref:Uncharacterized protein n=1 Tax=Dendrobium thyrsiflorum TaxID=117978 RepID=A0ABD0U7F1_DENTH
MFITLVFTTSTEFETAAATNPAAKLATTCFRRSAAGSLPSACIRTITKSAGFPTAAPTAPAINPARPIRVVEYRVCRSTVADKPEKRAEGPSAWKICTPTEMGPGRRAVGGW